MNAYFYFFLHLRVYSFIYLVIYLFVYDSWRSSTFEDAHIAAAALAVLKPSPVTDLTSYYSTYTLCRKLRFSNYLETKHS